MIIVGLLTGAGPAHTQTLTPTSTEFLFSARTPVGGAAGFFGFVSSVFGSPFSPGVLAVHTNETGNTLAHVEVAISGNNDALLLSSLGLTLPNTPPALPAVIAADDEFFFNSLDCVNDVPCGDHVMTDIFSVDVDDAGTIVVAMSLEVSPFAPGGTAAAAVSGIFIAPETPLLLAGEPLPFVPVGLDASTTIASVDTATFIQINDAGQMLVSAVLDELSVLKRALLLVDFDASGPLGVSLVAAEGGPVGAGPDMFVTIGAGPHAQSIDNTGNVLFSATTASTNDGLYLNDTLLVAEGDATPTGGTWGTLVGQPVDLSDSGSYAFRGVLDPTVNSFAEIGDAGQSQATPNVTIGAGPITSITGALADAHDVDLYRIFIDDPATFSASTVGSAAFDTTLYLFDTLNFNANGIFRDIVARNDDAAPSVPQSTLDGTLIPDGTPDTYILGVATNQVIPLGQRTNAVSDALEELPRYEVAPAHLVVAGNVLHWVSPATGTIERFDLGTSTPLAPLAVSTPPDSDWDFLTEEFLQPGLVAINDAGTDFLYHNTLPDGPGPIRRTELDGSNLEPLVAGGSPLDGDATIGDISDLATDGTSLYWSDRALGELWTSDADGANSAAIFDEDLDIPSGTRTYDQLAADSTAGKLYWSNPITMSIERSNLDGTGVETVASTVVEIGDLALDDTTGTLYYTDPGAGTVTAIDTGTPGFPSSTVASGLLGPTGIAVDAATGDLYIGTVGTISKLPAGGSLASLVAVEDTAQRATDGLGWQTDFIGSFELLGAPGASSLPYEIQLTGASFFGDGSVIAVDNTRTVAGAGDVVAATDPAALSQVGSDDGPIKLTETGEVFWFGRWAAGGVVDERAVFLDRLVIFDDQTTIGGAAGVFSGPDGGALTFDASESGEWLIVTGFYGAFNPPPPFAAGLITTRVEVDLPCLADLASPADVITLDDVNAYLALLAALDPTANFVAPFSAPDAFDLAFFGNLLPNGCP
ncbi:MAG: hypothetical protein AAGI30_01680 [Planctomycetota bacterium]